MNSDLYCLVLETLLEEAELNEFSGVGAIGGVATPLGAGPSGRVSYRDGNSKSNSAYKKKKKTRKKSKKSRSPSWYIKNGPSKKTLKEQNATRCLTSGAQFHISTSPSGVGIDVDFPFQLNLDENQAIEMETLLHNAIELVLSRYWN
tara:strand:- start:1336 stop:1776 length:441 start_codon:yes stop_codon:yes gene_type:complete